MRRLNLRLTQLIAIWPNLPAAACMLACMRATRKWEWDSAGQRLKQAALRRQSWCCWTMGCTAPLMTDCDSSMLVSGRSVVLQAYLWLI